MRRHTVVILCMASVAAGIAIERWGDLVVSRALGRRPVALLQGSFRFDAEAAGKAAAGSDRHQRLPGEARDPLAELSRVVLGAVIDVELRFAGSEIRAAVRPPSIPILAPPADPQTETAAWSVVERDGDLCVIEVRPPLRALRPLGKAGADGAQVLRLRWSDDDRFELENAADDGGASLPFARAAARER